MAVTICTDSIHENATDKLIQQFAGESDADAYEDYRQLFDILSVLNVENMHLIEEITNIDRFANLTGDDLLNIVVEVIILIHWKYWIVVSDYYISNVLDETPRYLGSSISFRCNWGRGLLHNIENLWIFQDSWIWVYGFWVIFIHIKQ